MTTKKLSNSVVDERLKNKNIERIGNYINMHTKIEFKCKIDGHIWSARPYNILYELSGCPKCSKSQNITNEIIDNRLKDTKIIRISNYESMHKKMDVKCIICNNEWKARPYAIANVKQGCPKCTRNNRFLTNEYIDSKIKNKPFIRIDDYVDSFTSIRWQCKKDNFIWKTTFTEILRGSGCPICKNKHEKKIKSILENEYKIKNLKPHKPIVSKQHNRKFYIDFYFEVDNKKVAIEYNGIQHYQPIRFNGISQEVANENFEKQKIRDNHLIEYCNSNNIELVWIPYWFSDIEIHNLLNEFLGYYL